MGNILVMDVLTCCCEPLCALPLWLYQHHCTVLFKGFLLIWECFQVFCDCFKVAPVHSHSFSSALPFTDFVTNRIRHLTRAGLLAVLVLIRTVVCCNISSDPRVAHTSITNHDSSSPIAL